MTISNSYISLSNYVISLLFDKYILILILFLIGYNESITGAITSVITTVTPYKRRTNTWHGRR